MRGSNWEKTFFQIYINFHTSLDFDPKNAWSESFFTGCHNCNPRLQRHFWLKVIFLRKVIIVHLFWSLSTFFVFWQKKVRMSKKQPTNTEKKLEERICGKIVFLNHFRTPSRKVWTIRLKIIAGLSKLLSMCSDEQF